MILVLDKVLRQFKSVINAEEKAFVKELSNLQNNFDIFEKNSTLEKSIECMEAVESLQRNISDLLLEKSRLIHLREILEINDPNNLPGRKHSEGLESKINMLHDLWTTANEWEFYKENWFHGNFGTIDIQEMCMKLEQWRSCLTEILEKDLASASRNTANRIRLQTHSFNKHVPIYTKLRHPGCGSATETTRISAKTFQQVLDNNINLEKLQKIYFVACEEYKIEVEVSQMIKLWNSSPIFRKDELDIIHQQIEKDSFRLSILLQNQYATHHELKMLEWQSDLGELRHLAHVWKLVITKWNRFGFLLHDTGYQEMCKKGHIILEKVSKTLSSLLSVVNEKPFMSNNIDENIRVLENLSELLLTVDKLTAVYISAKRNEIPRLYFVQDADVFEVLKKNMSVFPYIFGNGTIARCTETSLFGRNGRELPISKDVRAIIEKSTLEEMSAVTLIEGAMYTTVQRIIYTQYFSAAFGSPKSLLPDIDEQNVRSITLEKSVFYAHWTRQIEAAFSLIDARNVLEALKEVYSSINLKICKVSNDKKLVQSLRIRSDILLIYLSVRDDTDHLIKNLVRSRDNFIWNSLPKTYVSKVSSGVAKMKSCVLNHTIDHQYEFIGDHTRLVLSPKKQLSVCIPSFDVLLVYHVVEQ